MRLDEIISAPGQQAAKPESPFAIQQDEQTAPAIDAMMEEGDGYVPPANLKDYYEGQRRMWELEVQRQMKEKDGWLFENADNLFDRSAAQWFYGNWMWGRATMEAAKGKLAGIFGYDEAANKYKTESIKTEASMNALRSVLSEFDKDSVFGERIARAYTGANNNLADMIVTASAPGGKMVGAAAYLGMLGSKTKGQTRAEELVAGSSYELATSIANAKVAIEVGTTVAFGLAGKYSGAEKFIFGNAKYEGLRAAAKEFGVAQLSEQAEEHTANILSDAADWWYKKEWPVSMSQFVDRAIDTSLQTFIGTAAAQGGRYGGKAASDLISNPTRRNFKNAGLGMFRSASERQAIADGAAAVKFRVQLHSLVGKQLESAEQADHLYAVVRARASKLGLTVSEYVEQHGLEIKSRKWDEWVAERRKELNPPPTADQANVFANYILDGGEQVAAPPSDVISQSGTIGDAMNDYAASPDQRTTQDVMQRGRVWPDAEFAAGEDFGNTLNQAYPPIDPWEEYRKTESTFVATPTRDAISRTGTGEVATEYAASPDQRTSLDVFIDEGHFIPRETRPGESPADVAAPLRSQTVQTDRNTSVSTPDILSEKDAKAVLANIEFLKSESRTIINAFEKADFVSLLHELGHLFRRDLGPAQMRFAARWAGVKAGGPWSIAAEEKFANGFIEWVRTGKAPSPSLRKTFQSMRDWIVSLYSQTRASRGRQANVTPAVAAMFESMFRGFESDQKGSGPARAPRMLSSDRLDNQAQGEAEGAGGPQGASQGLSGADPLILFEGEEANELVDRFRGLANHNIDQGARRAQYEADAKLGYPEMGTWAEAEAVAARKIAADPEGVLTGMLNEIAAADKVGGVLRLDTMEKMATAAILKRTLMKQVAEGKGARAIELATKLNTAFREARSAYATVINLRDPVHPGMGIYERNAEVVAAAMTTEPEHLRDQRRSARTAEQRKAVDDAMRERHSRVRAKLRREGIDVDNPAEIAKDTTKTVQTLRAYREDAGNIDDMIYEYWRNSILSGAKTAVVNASGNAMFAGWHLGVERATEGAINLLVKDPKAAQLGEFRYALPAMWKSLGLAWQNSMRAFRTELPQLEESLGRMGQGAVKIEGMGGAIPDSKGGRIIRLPFRTLLWADEFAKTLTSHFEAAAHAYRQAKAEGAQDIGARVAELMGDKTSPVWDIGIRKAQELAFQGQQGIVAEKLAKGVDVVRQVPGGKYVVPFRDTPASIFEEGLKRTPVLGALIDYAEKRRGGMGMADAGLTPTLARQAIALSAAAAIWNLVGGEDEEPYISGAAMLSDSKARELGYRGIPQPQSIRIGDRWYSYARIEPFATTLASLVDWTHGLKQGDITSIPTSILQQTKNKSYLDGVGDFIDASFGVLEGNYSPTARWTSNFIASWVPNLYRQAANPSGTVPVTKMWGEGSDYARSFVRRTAQATRLPGTPKTTRYDVWGRKALYNAPRTSLVWNLLSPISTKDMDDVTKMDMALFRWNERNPDDAETYGEADYKFTINKKTVYLTDEQYEIYAKLSGQYAMRNALKVPIDVDNPTRKQIDYVKRAIARGRKQARAEVIRAFGLAK